jgi:hypothetical protein
LILAETLENKIQKLVFWDTGGLENLALLWLGCSCSIFLAGWSVLLELKHKKATKLTTKLPPQLAALTLPGLTMVEAAFRLII